MGGDYQPQFQMKILFSEFGWFMIGFALLFIFMAFNASNFDETELRVLGLYLGAGATIVGAKVWSRGSSDK